MSDRWAAENLQTIRTLMERAAVYRRALAPVMTVTGVIGLGAALAGWKAHIHGAQGFVLYWLCIALVAVAAGALLIRRQALQQSEPFWSPPMRRVSQAMLPALMAGLMLGVIVRFVPFASGDMEPPTYLAHVGLPLVWVLLYGCAVHAAGFFMQRGIRVFGWIILLTGCSGLLLGAPPSPEGLVDTGYGIMGFVFGLLHLLYGLYLFATERRSTPE